MGAKPLALGVMPLVLETHGNAIVGIGPDFFDQFVVQFLRPLALQERQDLSPALDEFTAVAPETVLRVSQ